MRMFEFDNIFWVNFIDDGAKTIVVYSYLSGHQFLKMGGCDHRRRKQRSSSNHSQ